MGDGLFRNWCFGRGQCDRLEPFGDFSGFFLGDHGHPLTMAQHCFSFHVYMFQDASSTESLEQSEASLGRSAGRLALVFTASPIPAADPEHRPGIKPDVNSTVRAQRAAQGGTDASQRLGSNLRRWSPGGVGGSNRLRRLEV